MKIIELIKEINHLNTQDENDVVALATIDGEEYVFDIVEVHQEGVPYIELEMRI